MYTNSNSMLDAFKGMFGKVDNGMCRLSMNGSLVSIIPNWYKFRCRSYGTHKYCAR